MKSLVKILAFCLFIPLSVLLTSCEYRVDVSFEVKNATNDTIFFHGWGDDGANRAIYISPHSRNLVSGIGTWGGMDISITTEEAFMKLKTDYDIVNITRLPDSTSYITYLHDESATEEQQYFFKREAWECYPDGEEQKDRTYTFTVTDEMFDANAKKSSLFIKSLNFKSLNL